MAGRRVVKAAAVIAASLFYVFYGDWLVGRRLFDSHVTLKRKEGTGTRTVVVFSMTQASGMAHTAALLELFASIGDVVVVEYPRRVFSAQRAITETFDSLRSAGDTSLVLVGSSLGGQMVAAFLCYNRQMNNYFQAEAALLADTPADAGDLYEKRAWLARLFYPGWIISLFSKSLWGMLSGVWPTETDVDAQLLAAHYAVSRTYPLSGYADQIRSVLCYRPPREEELSSIPMAYLCSSLDDTVKPSAARKWLRIFGVKAADGYVLSVPSLHADFPAYPKAWRSAFSAAFRALGLS